MLLTTFAPSAVNPKTSFDVKMDASKLLFHVTFEADTIANLGGENIIGGSTLAECLRKALNGNISIVRQMGDSQKFICQGMPLADLMEIAQNNEGFCVIKRSSTDPANTQYQAWFSIELDLLGGIKLDGAKYIRVELESFSAYTVNARAGLYCTSIEISSVAGHTAGNRHLEYRKVATAANAVTAFDLEKASFVAVPYNTDRLFLENVGGVQVEYRANELEIIAADGNDIVFISNGFVMAFHKWRVVPCQLATKGTVQIPADSAIYLLTNKDYTV